MDLQHYQQSALAKELVEVIHYLHYKGWAPATSSNYSIRADSDGACCLISRSGLDKAYFGVQHLMLVDAEGQAIEPINAKPSAETLLHTMLYQYDESIQCVLHTHTVFNTCMSLFHEQEGVISFQGFEMQKGIYGVQDHEIELKIPVFSNSQHIKSLAQQIQERLSRDRSNVYSYLLAGHGLYAWGKSISEAKRHIETVEFLLSCKYHLTIYKNSYGSINHSRP